jgi:hypothetical protein
MQASRCDRRRSAACPVTSLPCFSLAKTWALLQSRRRWRPRSRGATRTRAPSPRRLTARVQPCRMQVRVHCQAPLRRSGPTSRLEPAARRRRAGRCWIRKPTLTPQRLTNPQAAPACLRCPQSTAIVRLQTQRRVLPVKRKRARASPLPLSPVAPPPGRAAAFSRAPAPRRRGSVPVTLLTMQPASRHPASILQCYPLRWRHP